MILLVYTEGYTANMKTYVKYIIVAVLFLIAFGVGRFVYYNVIVPWPYPDDLKSCLEDARSLDTQDEMNEAEANCFSTYPQFL